MRLILILSILWVLGLGSYLLYDRFWPGHTGTVVVLSDPAGADIWMDLVPTGRVTPAEMRDVPQGKHSFTVRKGGERPSPFVQVVPVARASVDTLTFVFEESGTAPAGSDLYGSTTPPTLVPPAAEDISDRVKRELPWEVERKIPLSSETTHVSRSSTRTTTSYIEEGEQLSGITSGRDHGAFIRDSSNTDAADISTSNVEISSSVPGALIIVNDKPIGKTTPAVVALPLGTHTVRVELAGYNTEPEQHVVRLSRIAGGQLVYFTLTEELRARKEITITTEPVAGPIFVNGDSVGIGLAVIPHDFGVFEISFGHMEGYLTPEPQRLVVTPTKPNPTITAKYPRAFEVSATCQGNGEAARTGDIRWETGIYDRDKGVRTSDTHGPKINEIPGSSKSGWELAMGDPNRNPTGADYIEFIFTLPDEVPPSSPLNLRLYLYRSNRKYPLSLSSRCEVTVTVNGRVFLDNFRPRNDQSLADAGRYEEWSLQHSLVTGENRILIRTGDKNQIFNYLWKFEVL